MKKRMLRHKHLMKALVLASFIVGTTSLSAEPTPSANEITEKIQNYYASINNYQAVFVQTVAHKMFESRLQRSYGKVFFRKGGLMRWEYNRPEKKYFIYDGKALWIYEPDVPQIITGTADAEKLRKGLAFISGEGRILDEYTASMLEAKKYNFKTGYVLLLKPKQKNSPFKYVEIYVDGKEFRVVRSVVVDHDDNRNRLDFTDVKINGNLPANMFTFTPPEGVPVIDAAKQAAAAK